jgi:predicted transcriptional regulator
MRKLLPTAVALLLMAGLAGAAEVTLIKYDRDKKVVTVKEGDEQKTYRITDRTKVSAVDPSGSEQPLCYDDAVKGLGNQKATGKLKFSITAKGDEILEARLRARKRNG